MRKTVNFRAIEWVGQTHDLIGLTTQVLEQNPNIEDTEVVVNGETCEIKHRQVSASEVRLHFATYVDGARKPVTQKTEGLPAADLRVAAAPDLSNYAEKEIVACIRNTGVAYVAAGRVHPSFVQATFNLLLGKTHGAEIANRLFLTAQANESELRALVASGVDFLDLGLSMKEVDAEAVVAGGITSLGSEIGSAIRGAISSRFQQEFTDDQVDELALAKSRFILNVGKKGSPGQVEALTEIAADAVENDEEFLIRTLAGDKVRRDKLLLHRTYNQQGNSPLLSYEQAWAECSQLLDDVA